MATTTESLSIDLIKRPSITPEDCGCQKVLAKRLEKNGFHIETLRFGNVDNLWATHGEADPLFVFAGHTDVVPPGPENKWSFPPFTPTIHNGFLYGRGAADMKGSIAAMVTGCEQFLHQYPRHRGTIGFLITSDEEGIATNGTARVVQYLQQRGITIDFCIVGEPSSREKLCDTIKNGRRGTLNGNLTVHGTQGHVAYPKPGSNPIHTLAPLLQELCTTEWDRGNEFFQPTSFQVTNINSGTGADNIIPGELKLAFNFRYCTEVTHTMLMKRVETMVQDIGHTLSWRHSGLPFLTEAGDLLQATRDAIHNVCGYRAILSTEGGTSDGRFIAPTGTEVIEIGPCNETIHRIDERVKIDDLNRLSTVHHHILANLLG
ncbi:succinyl-diaminopimelate desuccinylase [Desulfomarina sp.]